MERWPATEAIDDRDADHATDAEEEYLQTLFWLFEAGLPMTGRERRPGHAALGPHRLRDARPARARRLHRARSRPRRRLHRATGRAQAEEIVCRHRLIERFLTDVVGVPWDDVHEEAEHLEHAMSPALRGLRPRLGRRRQDLPARPSDPGRQPHRRRAARRLRGRRQGHDPALRERGRGPPALPQARRASSPGARATIAASDEDEVVVEWPEGQRSEVTPLGGRDGLGHRGPVAPAAHRAARAARARRASATAARP